MDIPFKNPTKRFEERYVYGQAYQTTNSLGINSKLFTANIPLCRVFKQCCGFRPIPGPGLSTPIGGHQPKGQKNYRKGSLNRF